MEALRATSLSSFHLTVIPTRLSRAQLESPILNFPLTEQPSSSSSSINRKCLKSKLRTAISSTASTEITDPPVEQIETVDKDQKFDWFSQWYPIMPVCDLDKRVPHAKKVMGLDVVVWWDKNESAWKVFDDSCPHRLAPLSEGRIDQWGRLQCVYHGWCFNGSGDCKFIPQAPPGGPQFNTFKKACVAVYPSTMQNDIVWFWPNTDPQYKYILEKKKPPYIPELDNPSYTKSMGNREIPYGYEVLTENLMDPAHVPYAHHGIMRVRAPKEKADREGGRPLEISVQNLNINGFIAQQEMGNGRFFAPCVFFISTTHAKVQGNGLPSSTGTKEELPRVLEKIFILIFMCVPVSPGNSRLIWVFPRNFGVWIDQIVPRWLFHVGQNLILDSDLYLLHLEERKIMDIGPSNWQKACFTPTKSDALVVGFRKWLNKYAAGHIDWGTKFSGALPPTPPREQLLDRYWSHTVNCRSCSAAYKYLNALEVVLQVVSVASIGVAAAAKQSMISAFRRYTLVFMAVLCFAASRWLSHFIYKNFHYHDYNHALL